MDKWLNQIIKGDCLEVMKELPDKSVDSIVTDPPYELGFMEKSWDKTGIVYNIELWQECLRVLKPGGHLLAFGGSRTYHRMACTIEDAGFEIRDQIMWIYGGGMPKGINVSKAIDKKFGAKRTEIISGSPYEGRSPNDFGGNKNGGICYGDFKTQPEIPIFVPVTPEAQQWDGWNSSLKPAHEPIVVARKPLSEKTLVENVLKWGTGGINIDGCRIESNDLKIQKQRVYKSGTGGFMTTAREDASSERNGKLDMPSPYGRFPANIILDEEAGEMLDEQSGHSKSKSGGKSTGRNFGQEYDSSFSKNLKRTGYDDSGGASRFFKQCNYNEGEKNCQTANRFMYCAKASKAERGEGNNHPTVKPISLIEYLVTLVTPPNGVVLDPFIGSGTTAIASINKGFNYIGFELNEDYFNIANKRISDYKK